VTSLKDSPIGQTIVITGHDHRFAEDYEVEAYLPDPLPRNVDLRTETWRLIGDAMAELGRLDSAAIHLPNPRLVARVATRLEAVGTSALEGTYAELSEIFAAEILPDSETNGHNVPQRVREVVNYIKASDFAFEWVADSPITRNLMSAVQEQLVEGTESDGPEAGNVRTSQVFVGPKNRPITEARYVPPPPGDQLEAMYESWFDWVRDDRNPPNMSVLVAAALAHYQFETIHPYNDGNGRVGRLGVALQLIRAAALSAPVLSISPWLKDHEDDYKDHLLAVSETGKWDNWVSFFAEAIIAESRSSQERIKRLLDLRDELGLKVRKAIPRGRLSIDVVDDLIEFPIISVASVASRYAKTNQAARNALNRLIEIDLLQLFDDRAYDRLYWSPKVFDVIGN